MSVHCLKEWTNGTCARDSVSRVARAARAVEQALGVGTVGVSMAAVGTHSTFIDI